MLEALSVEIMCWMEGVGKREETRVSPSKVDFERTTSDLERGRRFKLLYDGVLKFEHQIYVQRYTVDSRTVRRSSKEVQRVCGDRDNMQLYFKT